jgi:TldD protein
VKILRSAAAAAALVCAANSLSAFDTTSEIHKDVQLRAMTDEIARSKTLQLNNLDKPYFIEYTTGDADQLYISTSLGGITTSNRLRMRSPRLAVRVGDYKFDNTNSVFSGTPHFGMLPIDDDYLAIRTAFWMATDTLYKASADQITRKRNALREIADPDKTPDLAPAKPVQILQPPATLTIDSQHWEDVLRRASSRFVSFSSVMDSSVRLRAIASTYRLVNTEGTVIRVPQNLNDISIRASALATDGSRVWNHAFVTVLQPSQFPDADQVDKLVQTVATETDALTKAPLITDYSGPVLFEQEAAAQMMAAMMADAARLHRRPLAPPGGSNRGEVLESVWATRLGAKVVPDWLSISDNPLLEQFNGVPLAGHYQVDDEGGPAEQVTLVDKGTLKGFLASREPVRDFNASNGHGRLPDGFGAEAPVIGNLFVQASQAVSEKELRDKLLEKAKAAGLKYGIILRRLDFPSTASISELQSLGRQLQKGGFARTLNPPLLAYRLYPDGHEELVRGVRFREFSAKDLRDIALASNRPYVFNYVNNGSSFNYADASPEATTSTVICPSLLFDSIDLARAEDEPGKLPVVPPPALVAQQ